jgi:CheY-like chemotaxis protein
VVAQEALPTIESRILLADDRRDIWRIGKYFLEKAGATVTVVEDGLQAVEETERAARDGRPFDLIIMDMQMPVMTGPEAVAELRQAGFDRPIIALTADVMDGEREACIAMGCNDYFPKPINGSGLVKLVAMHLGAR